MKNTLLIAVLVSCLISCLDYSNKNTKKTIILSKASENYTNWIQDDNITIIDAYKVDNIDSILLLADGIILTGGEDINPLEYNDTLNIKVCGPIDYRRDTLERKLFNYSLQNNIPFIGICRGMQMMNVASGGTLYGDIPTELGDKVVHRNNGEVMHEIVVQNQNSYYESLIFPAYTDTFLVNSWHHQGLKFIANNIHIVAKSYDNLPEAAVMDSSIHSFMIAVQFHPERLDPENAISLTMRKGFFNAIFK
tara:strand:+ start:241 stop:990 length:750 start_codon:yes stop_codon:yes gene_type:complete